MHRSTIGLIALLVAVTIGCLALQGCSSSTVADEPFAKAGMAAPKTMPCPMHGKMDKGKMVCTCPMHPMMGPMMRPIPIIIATQDGGVAVMVGDKLMKFDKSLVLVGETKIKMDFEGMEKKADQPMKERPSHKSTMKKSCPMKKDSEK
jgi:hypothetical protein